MDMRIAVAGTGAIGALMGSYLTKAGYDTTMISLSRPEQARLLRASGLSMEGYQKPFHVEVKAEYLPDLSEAVRFDYIFLTTKSNQLESALPALTAHLSDTGVLIPMQNGINDELLRLFVPESGIVTCVTFAGGAQIEPGRFMNHDGMFYVGGPDAAKVSEVAEIASAVRETIPVDSIRSCQWDKLSRVCLSVPTATVSGLFLGDVFLHPATQRLFAALALELFAVAEADGCPRETVEEKDRSTWQAILDGTLTGLEHADEFRPWPPGIVDAYTADIRKGQPLEIDFTNGTVIRLGRQYGVPTPVNEALVSAVHAIEAGTKTAGLSLLEEILSSL